MRRRRSEQRTVECGAFQVDVDPALPGVADAAVQLHRLAGDLHGGGAGVGLGHRRRHAGSVPRPGRRRPPRRVGRHRHDTIMSAQACLTAWNEPMGAAELVADPDVRHRRVQHGLARARGCRRRPRPRRGPAAPAAPPLGRRRTPAPPRRGPSHRPRLRGQIRVSSITGCGGQVSPAASTSTAGRPSWSPAPAAGRPPRRPARMRASGEPAALQPEAVRHDGGADTPGCDAAQQRVARLSGSQRLQRTDGQHRAADIRWRRPRGRSPHRSGPPR